MRSAPLPTWSYRQWVCLNGRCSPYLYNNAGVLRVVTPSTFVFSVHLKHAGNPIRQHIQVLVVSSKITTHCKTCVPADSWRATTDGWSIRSNMWWDVRTVKVPTKKDLMMTCFTFWHGLVITKKKCAEYLLYPKNNSSFLNGVALPCKHTVKFLGVHFFYDMIWSVHNGTVRIKTQAIFFICMHLIDKNWLLFMLWILVALFHALSLYWTTAMPHFIN